MCIQDTEHNLRVPFFIKMARLTLKERDMCVSSFEEMMMMMSEKTQNQTRTTYSWAVLVLSWSHSPLVHRMIDSKSKSQARNWRISQSILQQEILQQDPLVKKTSSCDHHDVVGVCGASFLFPEKRKYLLLVYSLCLRLLKLPLLCLKEHHDRWTHQSHHYTDQDELAWGVILDRRRLFCFMKRDTQTSVLKALMDGSLQRKSRMNADKKMRHSDTKAIQECSCENTSERCQWTVQCSWSQDQGTITERIYFSCCCFCESISRQSIDWTEHREYLLVFLKCILTDRRRRLQL